MESPLENPPSFIANSSNKFSKNLPSSIFLSFKYILLNFSIEKTVVVKRSALNFLEEPDNSQNSIKSFESFGFGKVFSSKNLKY